MEFDDIIAAAVCAPSGDNCQPWKIRVEGNRLHLYNVPERDTSLFNYRQRASLVAHGALLENVLIASSALGYAARVGTFPDRTAPDLVATVTLEKSAARDEPLYPFIPLRATNRKKYRSIPLPVPERNALLETAAGVGTGKVTLVEGEGEKKTVAGVIGLNDRLVFENRFLHEFLFEHIRWSDAEARQTRDGLDIRTLELAPLDVLAFRMFRSWSLMEKLNRIGISRIIARQAEKLALSASVLGVVTVGGNSGEDFVQGGRVVQRLWLETTRLGLAFQPMTGITFLMQQVAEGETGHLAAKQAGLLGAAREKLATVFNLADETVVMMFRTGYSSPPGVRSLRLPLASVVQRA